MAIGFKRLLSSTLAVPISRPCLYLPAFTAGFQGGNALNEISASIVPLTKVTLYKHGIGYFERRGKVKAPGYVELQCGPDEIDDMLKSLLILKTGGSSVSAVTYESSKPLDERLGEFGFDLKYSQNLTDLIGQLKGTPVSVKLGSKEVNGRVLGMDTASRIVDGNVVDERYLLIFSEDNVLVRIDVAAINGIEIKDAALAKEVQQQLELLFLSVKKKDRKLLKVDIPGEAENDLIIAYSIPCPIWKTSYRLVFDDKERLLIQGVAIVDNIQEEDWTDVRMVLVSASPISFIQPLYEPIKPQRRTIETQGFKSSGPFVAEPAAKKKNAVVAKPLARGRSQAAAAPMEMDGMSTGSYGVVEMCAPSSPPSGGFSAELGQMADSGLDVEAAEKGELFEYRIGGTVSVPRNSSALIPVVQEYIEGERISLFNESRDPGFPYSTLKLKNTTGLTLEGGPATVMEDDSYAGECLLDVVKPDDTRFLPYALDQSVRIIVRAEYSQKPVSKVQVYDSILYFYHKEISKKSYQVENLASKTKIVYIEHNLMQDWTLSSEPKPDEITKNFYRYRLELKEKEDHTLEVEQEKEITSSFHLAHLDPDMYQLRWLFEQNVSDPKFLEFMRAVQIKRRELVSLGTQVNALQHKRVTLEQDQLRARENVKTLGASAERFKQAIELSEDKIIEAQKQIDALSEMIRVKTEELNTFVFTQMATEILPS